MGDNEVRPNHQPVVIRCGGPFITDEPDAARRFMRTCLRAVREYNEPLVAGRIAGPGADEIISIRTEYTSIKDPAVYRVISARGCHPDGSVDEAGPGIDLQFRKADGHIQDDVAVDQAVDQGVDRIVVQAVLKELGLYERETVRA